ncbi:hypothetical protein M409DRAFT_67325 [Zasmidium cellare ATCC 36951]|uniref:Major facilitator superfamily (MFS) profile domain-containing protein n=1 Tax=Zasmidium cellare ATCC 36951 TaxID=1080233 RepID=A0A6A6CH72_ZASCE|nr:uncharacterized protein M409DRAFT_67325 [Zasmidium cellare ATCC 36951]KAF2165538.1 hypothetical protein M409DRAFT_67325 [Zasmidium cellare ATCC 36951]
MESNESLDYSKGNFTYENADEEPQFHWRTVVACVAMFMLNFVQVVALEGPPAVLTYIGKDLNAETTETWIPNSLSLVQAVVGPMIASRKILLVSCCTLSFIGCAIAPGAQEIGRLIAAQTLIGFGFACAPLAYSVPAEILPRRWRSIVQGVVNIAAALGAIAGPLIIGALVEGDTLDGWRDFYWIQMALWGVTVIGLLFGYMPPKRITSVDSLKWWQKLLKLDLIGFFLLLAGLVLTLVGLTMGGTQYPWSDSRVIGTLVSGLVILGFFLLYEWKGTSTGILNHELFRGGEGREGLGRTFAICLLLIFLEGALLFAYMIFYPIMTATLFETDPFLQVLRAQPFWIANGIVTGLYGLYSSRFKSFRIPMAFGFTLFTAGIVGFATIEPDDSTNALIFSGLAGIGFGGPLVLIISAVQLAVPHHLICTATAVAISARGIADAVFTAALTAALDSEESSLVPQDVGQAVVQAGLPSSSVDSFIAALTTENITALAAVPGITPAIAEAGVTAFKQAMADSIRVVWEIVAPFGAVAVIACIFLGSLKKLMDFKVQAPVEKLKAKNPRS